MSMGEKIKKLREEKKWSQAELGRKIGIHEKHISKWENEKFIPNAEAIRKLAQLFDVSTDYILFDNVPMTGRTSLKDPEIIEQIEKIERLDDKDKEVVKRVIQSMVKNKELQEVMAR